MELSFRSVLEKISSYLPVRTIEGEKGVFLEKYLLFRTGPGKDATCLHLHHFLRSDEDEEPHDHPWAWAYSLVLVEGYVEQFIGSSGYLEERTLRPGSVNRITTKTRHRVVVREGTTAWTLFLSGPVVKSWGFYRNAAFGWQYIPWKAFMREKGVEPEPHAASILKNVDHLLLIGITPLFFIAQFTNGLATGFTRGIIATRAKEAEE